MLSNPEKTRSRRDRVGSHVEISGFPILHNDPPLSMCRIVRDRVRKIFLTFDVTSGLYNRHRLGGRSVTADRSRNAGVVQ